MNKYVYIFMLSLTIISMPKTVSAGYTDYYGLYEHPYNSTYRFTPIADGGTYHRQDNFYISGYSRVIFSERLGYPPIEGEDWTYKIKDPNNNQEISHITYSYKNQCVYVESNEWGPFKLTCIYDPSRDYVFYFIGTFGVGCVPTQPYRFGYNHSSDTMPDITYVPTEFEPGEVVFNPVNTVSPYLPAKYANGVLKAPEVTEGTAVIRLTVYDNYGCGVTVPNAIVDLKNTILPGSGSHEHFTLETEPGSGKYIESLPLWNTIDEKQINISVNADAFGVVNAKYKADLYGVDETITAKTHGIEPYSGGVRKEYKATENLKIAVPGLIPLDTSGATYTIAGDQEKSCDNQHNDPGVRSSHYVTLNTYKQIQLLNDLYVAETGAADLCLNDASLKYGGFFDNGKDGRAVKDDEASIKLYKCHGSHRRGIDIDVNVVGCEQNLNDELLINNTPTPKREVLDDIAEDMGAWKAKNSQHYRFFE